MSTRPEARRLLTAREVASLLGVTPRWVYEQVDVHGMPAYRLGERALRFDREAIAAWLEVRRVGHWPSRAQPCAKPISRVPLQ